MTILPFHIVPNVKQNKVTGQHGAAIKIKLRAPTVEGKALRALPAEELNIPKRNIVLERGQQSRDKLIRIEGFSEEDVRCRLGTLIK
jgi:uncharacterized protein (TIGR00251 family)